MSYTEYLTPSERLDAIRIGAAMELADNGVSPEAFMGMFEKKADPVTAAVATKGVGKAVGMLAKTPSTLLNTAVISGLPLGLVMYAVHRALKDTSKKTRKMKRELQFYQDAVQELKNNYSVAGKTEGL